jgi:hypothetical protein
MKCECRYCGHEWEDDEPYTPSRRDYFAAAYYVMTGRLPKEAPK